MSHRFFVPAEQIIANNVKLTGSDVSHIRTVLRLKAGASIQVINGLGQLLTVRLVRVKVKEIQGEIIASEKWLFFPTPPQAITGMFTLSVTDFKSLMSYPSLLPSLSTEFKKISPAPFFSSCFTYEIRDISKISSFS